MKILLIDEVALLRELDQSFFKRKGLQILLAQNGSEVVQKAIEEEPDLIIVDRKMPKIDGVACCQKIKAHSAAEKIPILLIASKREAQECQQVGFHGFIEKPIQQNRVLESISRFLSFKQRRSRRHSFMRKVHCSHAEGSTADLFSKDICQNGIFLKTTEPFPKGSEMQMRFHLLRKGYGAIDTAGEIVRSVEYDKDSHLIAGMGVHFQNMQKKDRKLIADYLQKKL